MGEKRGRPKKETSKKTNFIMRMTSEDMAKLEHLSMETDKTKTEILTKALDIYYKMLIH